MVLVPAVTAALTVTVAQLPVGLNASSSATSAPLTVMSIGRFAVDPLEWRTASVAVPALAALTVHSTYEPTRLSSLTNPVPEKFRWLDSTTPCEIVAFSASYRVAAADASDINGTETAPNKPTHSTVTANRRDDRPDNLIDPPVPNGSLPARETAHGQRKCPATGFGRLLNHRERSDH